MNATLRILRSEVRKLFVSRAYLGALAISIALAVFSIVVDAVTAGQPGHHKLGDIAATNQMFQLGPVTCIALLVVGILAAGGEYRHRTIVATALAAPRRSVIVAAKAGAIVLAGVVLTSVTLGVGLATISAVLAAHHVHQLPANWPGIFVGTVLASTLFALMGAALGFLARSTVGAVVIFVGWAILGELLILHTVSPHLEKWLPVGLSTTLTSQPTSGAAALSGPTSALLLASYALILLVAAGAAVVLRDVD